MSILIKGMKMPESCWNCPCIDGEYGECNISGKRIRSDKGRHAECPLIELRNVANECYRGEVLYDAGINAVLKRCEE